jgi:hypothetical protein
MLLQSRGRAGCGASLARKPRFVRSRDRALARFVI